MDKLLDVPVIFLTADNDRKTEIDIFKAGAMDFIQKPFVAEVVIQRISRILELYHYQKSLKREVDKKTEELRESNKNKDEFIQEQSRKLTELLEQSNILLQNNQILLAQPEAQKENAVVSDLEDVEAEQITEEKPEKKSWFSGLFRNK